MRFLPYPGINPSSRCCGKSQAQEQSLQNVLPGSDFSVEPFLLSSISWHGDGAVPCCGSCWLRWCQPALSSHGRDPPAFAGQPAFVRALEHLTDPHPRRARRLRRPGRPQRRGAQILHLQRGEREAQRVGCPPRSRALRLPYLGQLRHEVHPLLPHVQQIRVPVLRGNFSTKQGLVGGLPRARLQSDTRISVPCRWILSRTLKSRGLALVRQTASRRSQPPFGSSRTR